MVLASLGLVTFAFYFIDSASYLQFEPEVNKWIKNNRNSYLQYSWVADTTYLVKHWFINYRYLMSAFRLPLLIKTAQLQAKWIVKILN